jgi:hypothetical protein
LGKSTILPKIPEKFEGVEDDRPDQIWGQGIYLQHRAMCAPKTLNV